MRNLQLAIAAGLSAALLAASASSADARWYRGGRYYGHGGPGLVGGVVIGALTVATLPFAILGAAARPAPPPAPYYRPGPYRYGPPPAYYGPPPPYYGPPPRYYGY